VPERHRSPVAPHLARRGGAPLARVYSDRSPVPIRLSSRPMTSLIEFRRVGVDLDRGPTPNQNLSGPGEDGRVRQSYMPDDVGSPERASPPSEVLRLGAPADQEGGKLRIFSGGEARPGRDGTRHLRESHRVAGRRAQRVPDERCRPRGRSALRASRMAESAPLTKQRSCNSPGFKGSGACFRRSIAGLGRTPRRHTRTAVVPAAGQEPSRSRATSR
jgi:hypothetical protein